jgi:hypothetical protein
MKASVSVSVAVAILLAAGAAGAQEKAGTQGNFVVGLERVFGIYSGHSDFEVNGNETEADYTGIELGIRNGGVLPSNNARLGFDYFVIDNLSLGAGIGFASYDDDKEDSLFLIAPRVGYFLGLGEHFGFWPRGGFTFWTQDDPDANNIMVTLEGMFTIAPNPTYAFLVGPVVDLGFSGEQDPGPGPDIDRTDRLLGIAIGMVGIF